MRVSDLIAQTGKGLTSNKIRSALTILGIVIGIASVIAMTSLINGVNTALVGQLGLDQAQLVYISVWAGGEPMTYDDVDRLGEKIPEYEYVTANSWGSASINTGRKKKTSNLIGVKPDYFKATKAKFVYGKGFSNTDEENQSLKVILDQGSVRVLFKDMNKDVTGTDIRIGNEQYKIVGIIEADPTAGGSDGESVNAFIPFSTMTARITGDASVGQVMGYVREGYDIAEVVKKTEEYLCETYGIPIDEKDENMSVYSMQSMIDSMNAATSSFSVLVTSVASISLVVGGIGIMNMMLTNVTERIREIGLRKALGARRWDITSQFLLESIFLCVIGGLIGIALGYFGAFALTDVAASFMLAEEGAGTEPMMEIVPSIDIETIVLVTGICVAIGVIFGWYPAYRAAKLDPVESLHYQ